MSAIIIPAIALGGAFLIYQGLTKKKKHKHHSDSSSSSNNKSRKHRYSSSGSDSSSSSSSSSSSDSKTKSYGRYVKNKTKKNVNKKEITVFYTVGSVKGKKWSYSNMPSGWSVNKKGDANKYTSKYTQMVQFNGSNKNKNDMKKYLIKVFEYLKKRHIVKRFKIAGSEFSNINI
jgi:hypothetical protein